LEGQSGSEGAASRDDARLVVAVPVERDQHRIGVRSFVELGAVEILEPGEFIAFRGRGRDG